MQFRVISTACLLALSFAGNAAGMDPAPSGAPGAPEATAAQVAPEAAAAAAPAANTSTNADKFLAEIDTSLALAREGGYGRLKRGDTEKLQNSRDRINELLKGHSDASELAPDERIALYNAQELISGILGKDKKDRLVCKKEPTLGSRLAGTECLTVGQREARARQSRENTDFVQRTVCYPGEEGSNPCQ